MEKRINRVLLGIFIGLLSACIVYFGTYFLLKNKKSVEPFLGTRINKDQTLLYTTSTNANYVGVPFVNVNDASSVLFTVVSTNADGEGNVVCSTQDSEPTNAATSTSNVWDYVDTVNLATEASVDGEVGITQENLYHITHLALRNNAFKWCSFRLSGVSGAAGVGTSTVYVKPIIEKN